MNAAPLGNPSTPHTQRSRDELQLTRLSPFSKASRSLPGRGPSCGDRAEVFCAGASLRRVLQAEAQIPVPALAFELGEAAMLGQHDTELRDRHRLLAPGFLPITINDIEARRLHPLAG